MRAWGIAAAMLLWGCVGDAPATDSGTDSSSEGGDAGCPIPNAGKGILCGNLTCSGPMDSNYCCVFDGGSTSCNCGGDGGVVPTTLFRWSCDKGSDCASGRGCCLTSYVSLGGTSCPLAFSSTSGKTDCMDACLNGLVLCANDDDCKTLGKTCKAIQLTGIPKVVGACL